MFEIPNRMKTVLIFILAMCWSAARVTAEESLPTVRILPEDVVQTSIEQFRGPSGTTNKFTVRWKYTGAGAKKMLTFWREHAGKRVLQQIGSFESRPIISTAKAPNWTEEGWLKSRTDKFFAVTDEDARKIVAGLKGK
jgi:hypothetical protein